VKYSELCDFELVVSVWCLVFYILFCVFVGLYVYECFVCEYCSMGV